MVARIKILTPAYNSSILYLSFILFQSDGNLFHGCNRFRLQVIGLFGNEKHVQYDEILSGCQSIINFVHWINNQNQVNNFIVSKRAGRPNSWHWNCGDRFHFRTWRQPIMLDIRTTIPYLE